MLYIHIGIGLAWFAFCAAWWNNQRREAKVHYVRLKAEKVRNLWIVGVLAHASIAAGIYLIPTSWHYINVAIVPLLVLYCVAQYCVFDNIAEEEMAGGSMVLVVIYFFIYAAVALVSAAPTIGEQRRASIELRQADAELKRAAVENIERILSELQEIRQQLERIDQRLEIPSE